MPIREDPYERQIAGREAEERDARRVARRYWAVAVLVCWAWCVVGGAVTVYGFVIVDPVNGPTFVEAGPLIAGAGTLITVATALYHRRERGYQ